MSDVALSRVLTDQHRCLDRLLEAANNLCGAASGREAQGRFCDAMERHLEVEERVLFPVLEELLAHIGPLAIMRQEHDAVRALMMSLRAAVGVDTCGPLLETLTVLIQQHHLKEERVLYPLSNDLLADCAPALIGALGAGTVPENERFLDLSQLPPPEPLESAMRAILSLRSGERLRLRVPREPYPLYGLISEHGFRYESQPVSLDDEIVYEILITRR